MFVTWISCWYLEIGLIFVRNQGVVVGDGAVGKVRVSGIGLNLWLIIIWVDMSFDFIYHQCFSSAPLPIPLALLEADIHPSGRIYSHRCADFDKFVVATV
jgi:hypothetical protein